MDEAPPHLKALWSHKFLLLLGLAVATVAAFFAGFTISDGQPVARAEQVFNASTTIMLESPDQNIFSGVNTSEVPGAGDEATETRITDLNEVAMLYAYIVSSDQILERVESSEVGELGTSENLTAVRRTTQPASDERFPGNLRLPVIEIIGQSSDPERAEQISREGEIAFLDYALERQEADAVPENERVILTTLRNRSAEEGESSNPLIPSVLTFVAVIVAVLGIISIVHLRSPGPRGQRRALRPDKGGASSGPKSSPETGVGSAENNDSSTAQNESSNDDSHLRL